MRVAKWLKDLMVNTNLATQITNFDICFRKLQKISCQAFPRKSYFTYFFEFVYNILSKIVIPKQYFSTLLEVQSTHWRRMNEWRRMEIRYFQKGLLSSYWNCFLIQSRLLEIMKNTRSPELVTNLFPVCQIFSEVFSL